MSIQSLTEADRKHLIHPVVSYRAHEARGVTILERSEERRVGKECSS